MKRVFCLISLFAFLGVIVSAGYGAAQIYVDAANAADAAQDGTLAHPWAAITGAVQQLAVSNDALAGGHTVHVAAGVYNEQIVLTNGHSGVDGDPNSFVGVAGARIEGLTNCVRFLKANYVVIDGFDLTGATDDGVAFRATGVNGSGSCGNTIRNCNIFHNGDDGIYMGNYCYDETIENCNIFGNRSDGVYNMYATGTMKNCNIVNNAAYGLCESDDRKDIPLAYNNIYANGMGNVLDEDSSLCNTEAEINAVAGNSNNITRNPGFSDLADDWNFNAFYANSPCLGAGEGGSDIGRHQGAPTLSVSTSTYYVATGGDDARTKAEARNFLTPWKSISRASVDTVAGDTVVVAAGTYSGGLIITNSGSHNTPVTFVASNGATMDGGIYGIHLCRVSNVRLDGFSTVSATSDGLYVESSYGIDLGGFSSCSNAGCGVHFHYCCDVAVENLEIYGNTSHGLLMEALSGSSLKSADIHHNSYGTRVLYGSRNSVLQKFNVYANASHGIASYAAPSDNSITITCCNVYSNNGCGIELSYSTGNRIQNCNIYRNASHGINGHASSAYMGGSVVVENSNVYDNGGRGVCTVLDHAVMRNCIIAENGDWGAYEGFGGSCQLSLEYSDASENITGQFYDKDTSQACNTAVEINAIANCSNNIVADPLFINPHLDFRFRAGSPCINAGTTSTDLETDFYGRPRLVGPAVDMGSYEMPSSGSVFISY